VASDRRIHGGSEVGVLFDNVASLILDFHVLASLVHFPEDLDSLPLNLGECSLFVLSLFQTNLFSPLGMLLLSFLFSFDESRLKQVEPFVLKSLDIVLTLAPFTELLFFHQLSAEVETSFVRSRRQGIFKCTLFPHLLN